MPHLAHEGLREGRHGVGNAHCPAPLLHPLPSSCSSCSAPAWTIRTTCHPSHPHPPRWRPPPRLQAACACWRP